MDDRIKLHVFGISFTMSRSGAYVLILADEKDSVRIPVLIGKYEAQSIAMLLEKVKTERPMTHDLFKHFTDAVGIVLEEVYIYHFQEGIFYSMLRFRDGERMVEVDSRASDAVALALLYGCPVYTTEKIAGRVGISTRGKSGQVTQPSEEVVNEDEDEYLMDLSVPELQRMLDETVEKEEYEKSSRIRDILKLKNKDNV